MGDRFCEVCGSCIDHLREDARTCSPPCRQKAYRRRKKSPGVTPCRPLEAISGRSASPTIQGMAESSEDALTRREEGEVLDGSE